MVIKKWEQAVYLFANPVHWSIDPAQSSSNLRKWRKLFTACFWGGMWELNVKQSHKIIIVINCFFRQKNDKKSNLLSTNWKTYSQKQFCHESNRRKKSYHYFVWSEKTHCRAKQKKYKKQHKFFSSFWKIYAANLGFTNLWDTLYLNGQGMNLFGTSQNSPCFFLFALFG